MQSAVSKLKTESGGGQKVYYVFRWITVHAHTRRHKTFRITADWNWPAGGLEHLLWLSEDSAGEDSMKL